MADDIARLGYEIDSSQARTAASDLDKMAMAAGNAAGTADKLKISNNGISTTYKAAALSAKQLATTNKLLQASFTSTGTAAQTMGKQVRIAQQHSTNLMFQFQDIGMMLAAGQNPLMLAMQQGTQVSGVFQQMKNSGQSAFAGIRAGLLAMVSPMSLLTIGAIAGGAALVQWGFSALGAGDEADRLAERMKEVEEVTRSLNEELRSMRLGVTAEELTLMDAIAAQQERLAIAERDASGARAMMLSGEVVKEREKLTALQNQLSNLQHQQTEKARMLSATRDLADAEREIWTTTENISKEAENLVRELGYAATKALVLADVDITSPISSAAKAAAVLAANLGISLNAALSLQNLQSSLEYSGRGGDPRRFGDPTNRDPNEGTGSLSQGAQDLITRARGASGGGGGGRKSAGASVRDEMQERFDALTEGFETESALVMSKYAKDLETLQWALEQQKLTRAEYEEAQNVLRIEAWGSEAEQQALQYELEQQALAAALEQRYITEAQYQARIADLRYKHNIGTLAQTQQFMGDMANALAGGNEKMAKIAQTFASVEALINAYRAYNQVLADPSLPWYAKIPAAVSVLAAGMKTVQSIKGASSSGGTSAAPSSASGTTATAEPERRVVVTLDGPDWVKGIIEPIMTQIYEQTADGTKVVFSR